MSTPAQILANRMNAQKSTGPRSAEGKGVTRFNALKHGADAQSLIVPGEDPAEFEDLRREYYQHFEPKGPIETALLETIVRADWAQRRCARLEAEVLNSIIASAEPNEYPLGAAFHQDAAGPNSLQKLFRRQQAAQRDWRNALADLRREQADRIDAELALAQQPLPAPKPQPIAIPAQLAIALPSHAASSHNAAPEIASPAKGCNWLGSEPPAWRL